MNQSQVIDAWMLGTGHAHAGALSTDGRRLYSYNLCIGITDRHSNKVAFKPQYSPSVTSARHINWAIRNAHYTEAAPAEHRRGCSTNCDHMFHVENVK